MTYTHSFFGVTPPARYDSLPWTDVRVEQGPSDAGPWTQIDAQSIAVDATPATPDPVDLTVTTATVETGFFRFRFEDAAATLSPYSNAIASPDDGTTEPWLPTVSEVGDRMAARTWDGTVQVGTFTADTTPTAWQVTRLIQDAAGVVLAALGTPPEPQYRVAKYAVICRTAMAIERGYYPTDADESDAAYTRWGTEYQTAHDALAAAIAAAEE